MEDPFDLPSSTLEMESVHEIAQEIIGSAMGITAMQVQKEFLHNGAMFGEKDGEFYRLRQDLTSPQPRPGYQSAFFDDRV